MDNRFKFFTSMIFSKTVMKTVFGKQDFTPPELENGAYLEGTYEFHISDSYLKEWNEFLDTEDSSDVIPYTYYWPWLMDYLMKQILPGIGINLRNVLHMGHDATFSDNFVEKIKTGKHTLKSKLIDLCPLSKNKIDMVAETTITSEDGEELFKATDHTIILNMRDSDMELLRESPVWDTVDVPFRDDSFRKKESKFSESKECGVSTYYCKSDIASEFGKVSGALSVTHASKLTASFFRKGKAFLQGMCTGNIVLKVLCHELGESISRFDVYFTNQLEFPQMIEVRYDDTRYEVFDEQNIMVAYGSRQLKGSDMEQLKVA